VLLVRGDQVLLIRRGGEPGRGGWDIPGGFLEAGETAEAAARRELQEELGVELGPLRLVLTDINPLPTFTVLDLIYTGEILSGEPVASDDAAAFQWFPGDKLPEDLAFATTRRLLERWQASAGAPGYRLLAGVNLPVEQAEIMARAAIVGDRLPTSWRAESGQWRIHDGALCGSVEGEAPAVLWCDIPITGDHGVLFRAMAIPPRHNDLNCFWEGSGTISGEDAGQVQCTIGGVGGWWDGLSGIERFPEGGLRSTGRTLPIQSGRGYEICGGRRGNSDFLFVDGKLALQLDEPEPHRRPTSRVALATWNSHVHFTDVRVLRFAGEAGQ
jgi:ADP-ribose pyrophosphatase YjhB (NUDIX family)